MKYPQLVSSRAVNAISDWLVSRLEQLGVEAPQIYTRLLLSLLQSSVQINDPIEFSNLETYFGNRKGQNRRYHLTQCDTDTLKKLNAIQCLKEIVSNEQEIDTIENLVDELCEKLKDIEKQLADTEDAENPLVALTLTVTQKAEGGAIALKPTLTKQPVPAKAATFVAPNSSAAKEQPFRGHSSVQRRHANPAPLPVRKEPHASQPVRELLKDRCEEGDNDPKKRYFNAFPALSKEMEESFRVWRRNAKSLTWPVNSSGSQAKGGDDKSAGGGGGSELKLSEAGANRASVASGGGVKPKRSEQHTTTASGAHCGEAGGLANLDNCDKETLNSLGGGAKRKSKRRRNRALSKGRNLPNLRKCSIGSNPVVSGGGSGGNSSNSSVTSGPGGGGKRLQQHQHRPKASSPFWDTNFEGCWEMGPDLIQEFFAKQKNKGNNNRRNNPPVAKMREPVEGPRRGAVESREATASMRDSPLMPVVDISFCCGDDDDDLDYDDTLMTIAELPLDKPGATAKRLYERETVEQPQLERSPWAPERDDDADDIAVFTSKFNSDVEALWKDAPVEELADEGPGPMFAFAALPCVAPFKENLMNFWSNYYSHQVDMDQGSQADQAMTGWGGNFEADDSLTTTNSQSLSCSGSGSALNCDLANTSDYYSMPSNLDDFEKSVGVVGKRGGLAGGARGNQAAAEEEGRQTPIGLFLQNTIWSENSCNATGGDTDESFYMKVWNSNKKLNQLEAANKTNAMEHGNASGAYIYPPYNDCAGSKWSEGINAGPPPPPPVSATHSQLSSHTASSGSLVSNYNHHNANQLGVDCPDSVATTASNSTAASVSTTSCSSSYAAATGYQWQTPVIGQNLQADLNSWSASNPKSLTDVYGGAGDNCPDLMLQGKAKPDAAEEDQVDAIGSSISLPNHLSNGASGFVEYARIKPLMQALNPAAYPPAGDPTTSTSTPATAYEAFADDDDLLTSERTHFHPILSYSDGHTFDICSSIDAIPYERSASGEHMYLEGDRYMEYKRPDNYIVEDDGTSGTASSNPLYGKRYSAEAKVRGPEDFALKFRVRQTDFACQAQEDSIVAETDAATRYYADLQRQREQHPLALIFAGASHPLHASPEALNKAVAAAAKAAAAAHIPTGSHWMPIRSEASGSGASASLRPSVWTAVQVNPNASEELSCDEVDFLDARAAAGGASGAGGGVPAAPSASLMDENSTCSLQCPVDHQWSMREVGQNCCGGHNNNDNNTLNNNNNNNNNYDSLDNSRDQAGGGGPHTLWGMCAACNGELKSVPANRLLRDELQQEADEIMSDLKYMQDLYIGRSSEEDDEEPLDDGHDDEQEMDDVDDDEDEVNVTHVTEGDEVDDAATGSEEAETLPCGAEDDDDNESEVMAANFDLGLGPKTAGRDKRAKYWKESMMHVEGEEEAAAQVPASQALQPPNETHIVLQKVNRLIADLLRPENAASSPPSQAADSEAQLPYGPHEGGDKTPPLSGDAGGEDKQFSAGIWYGKNERNIWQSSGMLDSNTLKPMELLRHFQIDPADSDLTKASEQNEEYLKLELNWEHENLSKIWNGEQTMDTAAKAPQCPSAASPERAATQREEAVLGRQKEEMHKKASAFRRMQQFLQSNGPNMAGANGSTAGGKLKLTNRKRRHSASQNFFHQSAMALAFHNNNNSVDVADLNVNSMKHFVSGTADLNGLQKLMHLAKKSYNEDGSGGGGGLEGLGEQTIITCKYWTTLNPCGDGGDEEGGSALFAANPNLFFRHGAEGNAAEGGNGDVEPTAAALMEFQQQQQQGHLTHLQQQFSCLLNKNASILNHVTMVTRPLTR